MGCSKSLPQNNILNETIYKKYPANNKKIVIIKNKLQNKFYRSDVKRKNFRNSPKRKNNNSVQNETISFDDTEYDSFADYQTINESCDIVESYISFCNDKNNISFTGDLKMEIQMMGDIVEVMPNTSSPILDRKLSIKKNLLTYEMDQLQTNNDIDKIDKLNDICNTYQEWSEQLHNTPKYCIQNVTRIPEAISGQFSPKGCPAYSNRNGKKQVQKILCLDKIM